VSATLGELAKALEDAIADAFALTSAICPGWFTMWQEELERETKLALADVRDSPRFTNAVEPDRDPRDVRPGFQHAIACARTLQAVLSTDALVAHDVEGSIRVARLSVVVALLARFDHEAALRWRGKSRFSSDQVATLSSVAGSHVFRLWR
jgi:hypothetical protein